MGKRDYVPRDVLAKATVKGCTLTQRQQRAPEHVGEKIDELSRLVKAEMWSQAFRTAFWLARHCWDKAQAWQASTVLTTGVGAANEERPTR